MEEHELCGIQVVGLNAWGAQMFLSDDRKWQTGVYLSGNLQSEYPLGFW